MDALKLACNDQRTIMTCVNVFIFYQTLISTKIDQSSQAGNLLPHKLWYIHQYIVVSLLQSTDIHNNTEQVREDSLALLEEAQRLKNDTSQDLRKRLANSLSAMSGLKKSNSDIEQKYTEVQFNIALFLKRK